MGEGDYCSHLDESGKKELGPDMRWAIYNPQGFLSNLLPLARIYLVDVSKQPKIVLTMETKCPKTQAYGDIYTQTITQRTCSQTWSQYSLVSYLVLRHCVASPDHLKHRIPAAPVCALSNEVFIPKPLWFECEISP